MPVIDEGLVEKRLRKARDQKEAAERDVGDALAQLFRGEYGMCSHCGISIEPERLKEVPWAAHCRAHRPAKEEAG